MTNNISIGTILYAVFADAAGQHIEKCRVAKEEVHGFWIDRIEAIKPNQNKEYYFYSDIGNNIFYSKTTASKLIRKE